MFDRIQFSLKAISIFLLTAASATSFGVTREEQMAFGGSLGLNFQQGAKLTAQSRRSCPAENKRLNATKNLRISIFYGYWNTEKLILDGAQAAALTRVLKEPCPPNLESCGFRVQGAARFQTVLTKKVGKRNITLSIYHTSVSGNGSANQDPNQLGRTQDLQSEIIERQFNDALIHDDVVFYSGHARYGGGLGFRKDSILDDAVNIAFRFPIRPMADALRTRPSRLKLLGLFTCESDRHYRYVVEDANPYINLIVTHGDILNVEGDQTMLGAVNSILMNKCDAEFRDSLISTVAPQSRILEYVRRPE